LSGFEPNSYRDYVPALHHVILASIRLNFISPKMKRATVWWPSDFFRDFNRSESKGSEFSGYQSPYGRNPDKIRRRLPSW